MGIDWRFDAWGGKYDALERDDDVARRVAELAGIETLGVDLVMEGGAIDVDGHGRLLATESSLLHPNRGERSKRSLETVFSLLLGADEVLWLKGGFRADDTDGHVDTVARFVGPGRVLAVEPPGEDHPDHANLAENLARLTAYREEGLLEEVISLPFAGDIEHGGDPLPASYANFYVANESVFVPVFDVSRDETAVAILEEAFPKRKVVPVPAEPLIVGYGSCHCLTQQIPAP